MKLRKLFLDFCPVISYILAKQVFNLSDQLALLLLVVVSVSAAFVYWRLERRISPTLLVFAIGYVLFGVSGIILDRPDLLVYRTRFNYTLFTIALFISARLDRPLAKIIMGDFIDLPHRDWVKMTYSWSVFFLIMLIFNEVLWIYSGRIVENWIGIKFLASTICSPIFILTQFKYLNEGTKRRQESLENEKVENSVK